MDQSERNIDNFVVHNFVCTVSPVASSPALLDAGRDLIQQASFSSGWLNVRVVLDATVFRTLANSYTFALPPPTQLTRDVKGTSIVDVQEWDTSAYHTADEGVFNLHDLDDFQSTNLDDLFSPRSALLLQVRQPEFDDDVSVPPPLTHERLDESPRKHPGLDFAPLYDAIPQPHFHPSPNGSPPFLVPDGVSPYHKLKPRAIPPLTLSEAQGRLNTPYARSAWIVPVRGILPWDRSTPASVLEKESSELSSGQSSDELGIIWTRASLCAFWEFLLVLRKSTALGPLSISFHAAPAYSSIRSHSAAVPSFHRQTEGVLTGSSANEQVYACRTALLATDHIKVYHDTRFAMYVRNVLDAWRYEVPMPGDGTQNRKQEKIRVLVGAKLVLVDERIQGILVS